MMKYHKLLTGFTVFLALLLHNASVYAVDAASTTQCPSVVTVADKCGCQSGETLAKCEIRLKSWATDAIPLCEPESGSCHCIKNGKSYSGKCTLTNPADWVSGPIMSREAWIKYSCYSLKVSRCCKATQTCPYANCVAEVGIVGQVMCPSDKPNATEASGY